MSTYFAILTQIGEAKLANAIALGQTLKLKNMAVGDGNGTLPLPVRTQKALVHEVRRAGLNQLSIDPANASQIIVEQVLPEEVGGWWIREIGIYDEAGDLCAVANCPPSYKPLMAEGSGRTQVVRVVLIVASTAAIELKIDPAIILATRKYVDDRDIVVRGYSDGQLAAHLAAADPHPQYSMRTVSTLPKFDASTKLANAAFVQQEQGNIVKVRDMLESRKLTADDIGCALYFTKAALTLTMPRPDELGIAGNSGKCVKLFGYGAETGTLRADAGAIIGYGVGTLQSITIKPGQFITLTATHASAWTVIESSAEMWRNPDFANYFNNVAPTPPKFSADTRIATTEFVQQSLGGFAGYDIIAASRAAVAADIGKVLWFKSAGYTLTLPRPIDLMTGGPVVGRCIKVFAFAGIGGTIAAAAGTFLYFNAVAAASVTVKTGQSLTLAAIGDSAWQILDSTAEMWRNADFADYFNNTAPTQAKFLANTKIATAEFVQQSQGNLVRYTGVTDSRALSANDIGCALFFTMPGQRVTIPSPESLGIPYNSGKCVKFFGLLYGGEIVPDAGVIIGFDVFSVPKLTIKTGQFITLLATRSNVWQVLDSTAEMGRNADFFASLEGNGHFKLPSGVLVQRGTGITSAGLADITFPVSFPKSCSQVLVTESSAGGWSTASFSCVGSYQKSLSGVKVKAVTYSSGTYIHDVVIFDWLAIGS